MQIHQKQRLINSWDQTNRIAQTPPNNQRPHKPGNTFQ